MKGDCDVCEAAIAQLMKDKHSDHTIDGLLEMRPFCVPEATKRDMLMK